MRFRSLSLALITILLLFLVACSSKNSESSVSGSDANNVEEGDYFNKTDMPIVDEPITISFMGKGNSASPDDYNDALVWEEYEKLTGIHIDWEMVSSDALSEKRNLALVDEDSLPDAFYTAHMPTVDLQKYGSQGFFIELNDLIEEYMPNLTKLLEENPDIRKGLTFPDGNIYSLPTIYDPEFKSVLAGNKGWIREDWLNKLDMDIPETTDDFFEYLKGVRDADFNKDGDIIPFGGYRTTLLVRWIKGAFGVGNRGLKHAYIDADPETDDVRFYPITDGYKEMLDYLNKLYDEDLILSNIFSIEKDQVYALGSEGKIASTIHNNPEGAFGKIGKEYVGMPALEGPNGDKMYSYVTSSLAQSGGFVITKKNENVPATLRWMDYFYSDEGAKLFFMGIEGVTFEEKDNGEIDYLDEIKNDPEMSLDQKISQYTTWPGGGYPGIVKEDYFKGTESLPSSLEATERFEDDIPEEVWPSFTYTIEEGERLEALSADIEKYVDEMQDKFITGDESLEEDWDKYVETIKSMGLEDYMEIQQDAYDRYKSN